MGRVDERMAKFADRLDAIADRLFEQSQAMRADFDSLREDVRRGGHKADEIGRQQLDLEAQILATREELQRFKGEQARAAASGAAEGAVRGASAETQRAFKKWNRPQIIMVGGMCFVLLTNTIEKGPPIARAIGAFFSGLAHLDGHK